MNRAVAAATLALLALSCQSDPAAERIPVDANVTPSPTPTTGSPTPTARTYRSAGPSATCASGWAEPQPGPVRSKPLDLLRQSQGMSGTFLVDDMRHWTLGGVETWYAKVRHSTDGSFRLRFLVQRRPVGEGVVAVAPYTTTGFKSPDWKGFDGEGGSVAISGVPGRWPGMPTDFVADNGLPADAAGCLA